jgi:hypothetical protein
MRRLPASSHRVRPRPAGTVRRAGPTVHGLRKWGAAGVRLRSGGNAPGRLPGACGKGSGRQRKPRAV